ncbi:MAG: DUF2191 domain-containing protein [Dehalococcoidia bacterium]|nr:DUF2191 domain-containing protein [Dehalococcoidia bacterium]
MRTTLDLDPKLLDDLVKVTGEKSKSKAVHKALEEYVRRKRTAELIAMAGCAKFVDNLKELEELELKESKKAQW